MSLKARQNHKDTMMTCGVAPKLVVALAIKYLAINT